MRLLSHGRVTRAEGGYEEGELGDVGDGFEEVLIKSLKRGDDGVCIVKTHLCSIQSSDRTIESGTVFGKICWSFTPGLQLCNQLLDMG